MFNTRPEALQDGWPIASPEQAHMKPGDLADLSDWIRQTYVYQNMHAVLISHAGKLVYELYLEGPDQANYGPREHRKFDVDSLHDLQSISKSVTSLLFGIAFAGEYESALATPIVTFFKDRDYAFGAGTEAITLQHVLTMTAGLQWDPRTYPFSDPRNSNHQLYYSNDPIATIMQLPVVHPPGSFWQYNNGLTLLLAAILEVKTGQRIDKYAARVLFEPLGIKRFHWNIPTLWIAQDIPNAAGGLRLRARDLTRIGVMVQNGGAWNGQQIVPAEWIKRSTHKHVSEAIDGARGVHGYGYQWWVGRSNSIPRYQMVAGFGNGGQQLLLVPDRHLVVTVYAGNYGRYRHGLFNWVLDRIVFTHQSHY